MKVRFLVLLLFVLVLICHCPAMAVEKTSGITDKDAQKVEVNIDRSRVSPDFAKILEAEEKGLNRIKDLEQRMKTSDENQFPELQKEIEKVKKDTELEVLKIRLEISKEKNDSRNIQEIEKAINRFENPVQVEENQESKIFRETWEKENEKR